MAATILEYYNTGNDAADSITDDPGEGRSIGQVFQVSADCSLAHCRLRVYRDGTPGTINIAIYAWNGTTHTGSALYTGSFDGDSVIELEAGEWKTAYLTEVTPLSADTDYVLWVYTTGATLYWVQDVTSPTYSDGAAFVHNADPVSWSAYGGTVDCMFELWGENSPMSPNDKRYTRNLVTFCNNKVYYGTDPDDLAELTAADGDIDCTKPLSACGAYGQVFVANHDSFRVADFKNVKLATGTIGSNLPYHGDIVVGGSSGAQMVVDFITASSSACTLYGNRITTATFTSGETVTGTNKNGDAVSFAITANEVAGPHWYAWTPYGNDTTNFGSMPTYSGTIELHIGRLCLTGDTRYPHQWSMTRQNNPWDFLYAQNDAGSAVAGNNTDAGEVGDIVVDTISYSDDYMVFGCASEMHVMLGNPCAGGRIDLLRNSGLLAARAWTWDDDGNLYMLSTEGILVVPKGFGQADNLTKANYPDFVSDLAYNPSIHRITLAYDRKNKGILITRIVISTGVSASWFLDLRSGGFFPESYPEECAAFCTLDFDADDPADSYLLAGCTDGYLRKWDHTSKSDDAGASGDEAIDAYIGFGPMATSESARKSSRISGIDIVAGGDGSGGVGDSDNLYCKVYVNANAQKVIADMVSGASPRYTKTHKSPGQRKGNVDRRKVFGRWIGLVIGNDTVDQSFAFEHMNLNGI